MFPPTLSSLVSCALAHSHSSAGRLSSPPSYPTLRRSARAGAGILLAAARTSASSALLELRVPSRVPSRNGLEGLAGGLTAVLTPLSALAAASSSFCCCFTRLLSSRPKMQYDSGLRIAHTHTVPFLVAAMLQKHIGGFSFGSSSSLSAFLFFDRRAGGRLGFAGAGAGAAALAAAAAAALAAALAASTSARCCSRRCCRTALRTAE
mmetsp:Transcript_32346/g.53529  ORF Transcript_32346/g.53529 Transcript_32346/m.53529 type:complete len:207 (+) Transcript_32346:759-1379(+)